MEVCNIDATDLFECWFDENQNWFITKTQEFLEINIGLMKHLIHLNFSIRLYSKRKRNDWNLHNLNETTNYLIVNHV